MLMAVRFEPSDRLENYNAINIYFAYILHNCSVITHDNVNLSKLQSLHV